MHRRFVLSLLAATSATWAAVACSFQEDVSTPSAPPPNPSTGSVDAGERPPEADASSRDAATSPDASTSNDASTRDASAPTDAASDAQPTTDAAAAGPVAQLTAGGAHTCARFHDGTVKCWGNNYYGALGLGDTQNRGDQPGEMGTNLPFVEVAPGRTVVQLAAGGGHTCARLDDGSVKCWGYNLEGQLGLGDRLTRGDQPGEMGANLPAVSLLGPGRTASQIAGSAGHTCARLDDGTVKCWGQNTFGQLGLGDSADRGYFGGLGAGSVPAVDLGPGRTAQEVFVASSRTCARLDDGTVKCWGANSHGELGIGDYLDRGFRAGQMGARLPVVDLGTGRTATQIVGGFFHMCARLDDGTVKCWGYNLVGQLGLGDSQSRGDQPGEMGDSLPAVDLGPGRTVLELAAGSEHTCARLDDGSVKCWGYNLNGQLGLGDVRLRGTQPGDMGANLPTVDLGPGRTATHIAAGGTHTCARLDDGSVKCWGKSDRGQLGIGDFRNRGDGPGEMGVNLPAVLLK
jgi:alpha-tubulin suppressor-like RCC1 family protein